MYYKILCFKIASKLGNFVVTTGILLIKYICSIALLQLNNNWALSVDQVIWKKKKHEWHNGYL